jgi:hypothetical protein
MWLVRLTSVGHPILGLALQRVSARGHAARGAVLGDLRWVGHPNLGSALQPVSARGHAARGAVLGDLGSPRSITTAGSEFGSR